MLCQIASCSVNTYANDIAQRTLHVCDKLIKHENGNIQLFDAPLLLCIFLSTSNIFTYFFNHLSTKEMPMRCVQQGGKILS